MKRLLTLSAFCLALAPIANASGIYNPGAGGSAGGSSTLAVSVGGVQITSPTARVDVDSNTMTGTAPGGNVASIGINSSSVTLQGNAFNAANKLLKLDGSGNLPAVGGASLTGLLLSQIGGGSAGANAYDFGSATSLTVPQGSNPTVDAAGKFGVDTSSGQALISTGSAAIAIPYYITNHITIATPTAGEYHFFEKAWREETVDTVVCVSSAATSATIQLYECDANGANCTSMDSATACTTTETAVTMTDTDIADGDRVRVLVTATSGTPGEVAIDMRTLETRR